MKSKIGCVRWSRFWRQINTDEVGQKGGKLDTIRNAKLSTRLPLQAKCKCRWTREWIFFTQTSNLNYADINLARLDLNVWSFLARSNWISQKSFLIADLGGREKCRNRNFAKSSYSLLQPSKYSMALLRQMRIWMESTCPEYPALCNQVIDQFWKPFSSILTGLWLSWLSFYAKANSLDDLWWVTR